MSNLISMDSKKIDPDSDSIKPSLERPVQSMSVTETDQTGAVTGKFEIDYNKPVMIVYGLQHWADGKIQGVCLYNLQAKAKAVAEEMNKEFARLKVNQEAKIINYPVF